jgi:hypothetical protein
MRGRTARLVIATCALGTAAALVTPTVPVGAAVEQADPAALLVVQRPVAVPLGAVRVGALPAQTDLAMRVVLEPRSPSALSAFIARASSPSSPDYGHYLARGRFAARFGPTSSAIAAVRTALRKDGLAVTGLSPSHLVLSVRGTASSWTRALHASFSSWRMAGGRIGYRADGAIRLPGALAADVAGIEGTSSLVVEHSFAVRGTPIAHVRRAAAVGPRQPPSECAAVENQLPAGTFTPEEEGDAYGLSTVWAHADDGQGHTVALLEFAPYALSDILTYDKCFGALPEDATSDPNLHNVYVDGGTSPGSSVASDEPTLDIEELRALAPQAQVDVYEGPNNVVGPLDTLQRIATDDTAQVVSISWGICEEFSDHAAETPIFEQLAAQGQTVFAASGDDGSSDCIGQSVEGGPPLVAAAVDDPSSQPLVTGVGGLTVSSLSPLEETVWNDCSAEQDPGCLGDAGGGGISSVYAHPAWQVAPGVPTGAEHGAANRDVPDLSVMGDPATGMLAFYDGSYVPYGGTSMGPPLLAAMMLDDLESCGMTTFGFLNPLLYAMGRHGGDFDDVTTGTNAVAISTLDKKEYDAGPGYDMASGLGSPDPSTFLAALCDADATAAASPTTPGASSSWLVTFHTGGDAYPVGTVVTLAAPAGTRLPSVPSAWTVATSLGTDAPSSVRLSDGAGSTTPNVAALTLTQGAPDVGEVTIGIDDVVNPDAVGTATVGISDSVDELAEVAPVALSAATPDTAVLSVPGGAPFTARVGTSGLEVVAKLANATDDDVDGARITVVASGHAVARMLSASTNDLGQVTFEVRDDRAERSTVTVTSAGVVLGTIEVTFTNPWVQHPTVGVHAPGAVVGIPSVAALPRTGFEAVARTRDDGLVVAASAGSGAVVRPLDTIGALPAVASNPSLVRSGAWLYAAYRSATGDLVVVSNPVDPQGRRWRVEDLTALGDAPGILGAPDLVVAGSGAHGVLSIAAVDASRQVVRVVAPLSRPSRFATTNLSRVAAWGAVATGSVAEVVIGGGVGVFAHSVDGELVLLARDGGSWLADDLAADSGVEGAPSFTTGDPSATVHDGLATVVAASRGGVLVVYVGALGNWSGTVLTLGAEGTSAPAGDRAVPRFTGPASVLVAGAATDVLCTSRTGRLIELSSLGVSEPWSSYDLTTLAHLHAATQGAAVLPGVPTSLLVATHGRLVLLDDAS